MLTRSTLETINFLMKEAVAFKSNLCIFSRCLLKGANASDL